MHTPLVSPAVVFHPFQHDAVNQILAWAKQSDSNHYLCASPTGTGKSFMQLEIHCILQHLGWWSLTPRVEIIRDMLLKCGYDLSGMNLQQVVDFAWERRITTPLRYHAALLKGKVEPAAGLIKDEAHHDTANTYHELDTMHGDDVKQLGFTGTPYRGTPRGTQELYEKWGQPHWAITYPDAFKKGYISIPRCETWGLIDDDLLEVSSTGEFVISRLTAEVNNNIEHALKRSMQAGFWVRNGCPRRPTLIGVPSSGVMPQLKKEAKSLGLEIRCITQETGFEERQQLFKGCIACRFALVHINVVSEGVDLPIRQYLDLAPCLSPMMFVQRFGRATRPVKVGEEAPYYVCTNRNLERHGYLFDGCLPVSTIREAQTSFPAPSDRTRVRAFGIQTLGKLQGFHTQLTNGLTVTTYAITQMQGTTKQEYLVVLHPNFANPLWFAKQSTRDGETFDWGKWAKVNPPTDLKGFKSNPPRPLTENQVKYWARNAKRHGIDPEQDVDAKRFQILPALVDIGAKLA